MRGPAYLIVAEHAAHGFTGDLSETKDDSSWQPIRAFSLLGGPPAAHGPRSGLGDGITYIPLRKGFLYLVAVVDLFSRHVLSWKLSNSLDTELCLEALEMAVASDRKPQIFHSDQGCQFSSVDFLEQLKAEEVKISWSGGGGATASQKPAAMTTSWWRGSGAPLNMRRSTSVPMAMVGKPRSAWPASYGGMAM